jgi:enoyl-CoA hydratase/carnithine racemase
MLPVSTDLLGPGALAALEGHPLQLLDAQAMPAAPVDWPIRVAIDRKGLLPRLDPAHFDALLTTCPDASAPWVTIAPGRIDAAIDRLRTVVSRSPVAATILVRVLRAGEGLPFDTALELESLAYSTLLGGGEFAAWLRARKDVAPDRQQSPPVRYVRDGNQVSLVLASPANRNAMTAAMRDALYEALANTVEDPSAPGLLLRAEGICFSVGGHLAEFGTATDLARAHLIRTARSCTALLHRLGDRSTVYVHGACIGSGIEIPAAAAHRIATPDSFVQLPEVAMGLIPGAGGTASLARAIGRHRLAWLAMSNARLGAHQALRWGLFHAISA